MWERRKTDDERCVALGVAEWLVKGVEWEHRAALATLTHQL